MTHALVRADNPDKPYGDVKYADPGWQADGKARYPLDSADHVRSAWDFINHPDNAAMYGGKHLKRIRHRIVEAGKEFGVEINDPGGDENMRSAPPQQAEILRYERVWDLEDIIVRGGGDGRTVEAYAAIWDTPAEVRDHYGHYMETINRSAFDKFIHERGRQDIPVYFNHGMTAAGTPSDIYSVPIGRSTEVKADNRGLWTISRYNDGPDADRVLDAIRNGAIKSQSFRGRVFKSVEGPKAGGMRSITRTELGLSEYGPTPTAVYGGAAILAVRSQHMQQLQSAGIDVDELLGRAVELVRTSTTPPSEEPETTATSEQEAGTDEPPTEALRSVDFDMADIRRTIGTARILREGPTSK